MSQRTALIWDISFKSFLLVVTGCYFSTLLEKVIIFNRMMTLTDS